jgi:hypothetical protein
LKAHQLELDRFKSTELMNIQTVVAVSYEAEPYSSLAIMTAQILEDVLPEQHEKLQSKGKSDWTHDLVNVMVQDRRSSIHCWQWVGNKDTWPVLERVLHDSVSIHQKASTAKSSRVQVYDVQMKREDGLAILLTGESRLA